MRANALVGLLGLGVLLTACGHGGSSGSQTYDSPQSIASALGCSAVSPARSEQDYHQETCTYGGTRLSIWWQSHSGATEIRLVPVWVHSVVGGTGWFVGCQQAADCEQVRSKIGGVLTGPANHPSHSLT